MRLIPALVAATLIAANTQAPASEQRNLIITQTQPFIGSTSELFNFSERFSYHNGRVCSGSFTNDQLNPVFTINVQTGEIARLTDSATPIDGSTDTIGFPFSCSLGDQAAAISAIFGAFRQGHFVVPIDNNGNAVGAPIKIIADGESLPDGTSLINADFAVHAGGFTAFRNGLGLYLHVLGTGALQTALNNATLFPGTGNTIDFLGPPLLLQSVLAAVATNVSGSNGVVFHDNQTGQVTLGIGLPVSPQGIALVDARVLAVWVAFNPAFQFILEWYDGAGNVATLLEPGSPLTDGDTVIEVVPEYVVSGTDVGVCAFANARVTSDPFGDVRMVRSCTASDGSIETEVLLTAGDTVDGEQITGWTYSQESADDRGAVVLATLGSGQNALTFVGDVPASDSDGDGIEDASDNCLLDSNADQIDADSDGFGNVCDPDVNNDCAINFSDLAIYKREFFTDFPPADNNSDGVVNFSDLASLKERIFGPPGPSGQADCP
ncbi:MAG: hypothetical protein AAFN78_11580 [Pseudomonadota bacterium]